MTTFAIVGVVVKSALTVAAGAYALGCVYADVKFWRLGWRLPAVSVVGVGVCVVVFWLLWL